jgi:hypothetical protein
MVYLVSVTYQVSGRVEHFILKLDRKSKTARSDELSRHGAEQIAGGICAGSLGNLGVRMG